MPRRHALLALALAASALAAAPAPAAAGAAAPDPLAALTALLSGEAGSVAAYLDGGFGAREVPARE